MKIAVLSDAHGNMVYLNECMNDIKRKQVDAIYYLGDFVGYFPDGEAVINQLRQEKAICVLGNHDAMLLGILPLDSSKDEVYQLSKNKACISDSSLDFLRSLPKTRMDIIEDKKVLFVHGKWDNPLGGYLYADKIDQLDEKQLNYDIIFMGHTHRSFIKNIQDKVLINVGSCGLPRDQGNRPAYVLYDFSDNSAEVVRLEIDSDLAIAQYPFVNSKVIECLNRR
jgi:putative phosphoesterase